MKTKKAALKVGSLYRLSSDNFFVTIIEIDYNSQLIYGLNPCNFEEYKFSSIKSKSGVPCGRWTMSFFQEAFNPVASPGKIWKELNEG